MSHVSLHPLWGSLALDREAELPLQDQIVQFFRSAILSGRLHGGRRVPSSRQLATEHGISRTTAVEAYSRLSAEGYLVSRAGAGLFVPTSLPEDYLIRAAARPAPAPAVWEGAQAAEADRVELRHHFLPLAAGMPSLEHFPWKDWARLTAQIHRERPLDALGYGDPRGEPALRQAIAEYLAVARGVVCKAEQIIIVGSSKQATDMVARVLASPGDKVWFEDPGHAVGRAVLEAAGLVPEPIPVDGKGLDVAEGVRRAPDARLALITASHHYPLGYTLSLERRLALLDWAETAGARILEDDHDGEYRYARRPLPPLYTLDRTGRVIYVGSFSNILAPGLRLGYLVAPPDLVEAFLVMRASLAPILNQLVLARFIASGRLASHLRRMRALYAQRRSILIDALKADAADVLNVLIAPDAGMRLVATLRRDVDDEAVSLRCLERVINVHPLSPCYAEERRLSGFVLGFAATPEEQIAPAVRTLAEIIRSMA